VKTVEDLNAVSVVKTAEDSKTKVVVKIVEDLNAVNVAMKVALTALDVNSAIV
jgi:hypothetical protein